MAAPVKPNGCERPPKDGWLWLSYNFMELIPEIGIVAFGVYTVLKWHANRNSGEAFPRY